MATATEGGGGAAASSGGWEGRRPDWRDGELGNGTSLASRLLFSYADPLLDLASERRLEVDDAFVVPPERLMGGAVTRLEDIYAACKDRASLLGRGGKTVRKTTTPPSGTVVLGIALLRSQKRALLFTGALRLANTIVQSFPSLIVARLLRQIEAGRSVRASKPLTSAFVLVSVLSAKMLVENQYFHNVVKCACEVRGSISGMIFDKSLRLSGGGGGVGAARGRTAAGSSVEDGGGGGGGTDEKKKKGGKGGATIASSDFGSGGVLNLMQSDVTIIEMLTLQLHTLWDGILQTSIYAALLYKYLGPPVIWGIAVLLTTIPINAVTLRILNRLNRRETEAKDARMRKTTESIVNMLLLKLQNWEGTFADGIQDHREEELRRLRKRGSVRALNQAISNAVPTITLVVTLSAYARTGKPIVASTIFTAISLFNQLRFPLLFYPMLIDSMANGKNSLRRISQYLTQEEIEPYVERAGRIDGGGGGGAQRDDGRELLLGPGGRGRRAGAGRNSRAARCVRVRRSRGSRGRRR